MAPLGAPASQATEHLLLLPPVPWPPLPSAIQAAYTEPVKTVLKTLASEFRRASQGPVLDVAVPVPYLYSHLHEPRAALYHTAQKVVARLYRLICIIAANEDINVEDAEGIDVRLVLVARPRKQGVASTVDAPAADRGDHCGPVVSITALARCKRPWAKVFAVESEDGEAVLRQLVTAQDDRVKIHRVPGGLVQVNQADEDGVQVSDVPYEIDYQQHHQSVAVGGTWDHVHIGHKLLLTMFAFMVQAPGEDESLRSLTCGVTGDEMLRNKKHAEQLESWDERRRAVAKFLRGIMDFRPADRAEVKTREINDEGPNGHAIHVELDPHLVLKLVEIGDPFGPTITDKSLSALVFSAETRSGGKAVNDKRRDKGWQPLQLFEVDVLDAGAESASGSVDESFASKLSSTTIRQRLSDRQRLKSKA